MKGEVRKCERNNDDDDDDDGDDPHVVALLRWKRMNIRYLDTKMKKMLFKRHVTNTYHGI